MALKGKRNNKDEHDDVEIKGFFNWQHLQNIRQEICGSEADTNRKSRLLTGQLFYWDGVTKIS